MLDLPALAAPPGLAHNFVNPSNMETEYYIVLILSLTISLLLVCMRMWTKAHLIQKFGREDCEELSISPINLMKLGADDLQGSASWHLYAFSTASLAQINVIHRQSLVDILLMHFPSSRAVVWVCINGTYSWNPSRIIFTYVLSLKIYAWLALIDFL